MKIIEPCCVRRHFRELRDSIGQHGKTRFQGFGDMSLTELLPALLTRYSETQMMIVAPTLPDQAAGVIGRWLKHQWARMDGNGKLDVIKRLTIIADLSEERSPMASDWLKDNPFEGRLTLVDRAQADTAILLPDLAITGPLNLQYGQNFICTVTTIQEEVDALWKQFSKIARRLPKRAASRQEPDETSESDSAKPSESSSSD